MKVLQGGKCIVYQMFQRKKHVISIDAMILYLYIHMKICHNSETSVEVIKIKVLFLFIRQDPVVQSIVSLTISLRHKFVKQLYAKVTNTLLFFVEKL